MGSSLDVHGGKRRMRPWAQRGMMALVLCLAIALLGCGSKAKGPAAGKSGSEKAMMLGSCEWTRRSRISSVSSTVYRE